ncbi:MAG TPA: class I SAM-dependent methyltransferase [Candidatus Saccharimonadales bacterium]|nr:class I SAM-dependent methyltransferase [Candidatus Saccharimonadales bacterium]
MKPKDVWSDLHKHYKTQDWIDKPSLFATQIVEKLPKGRILELGCGLGQDSQFFAKYGHEIVATDIEQTLLDIDERKEPPDVRERVEFKQMDLREKFPFEDESFDVVYAHLSLHYFHRTATQDIFKEIERVLKPHGVLAFLVNSTSDPEYNTGTLIEPDYFYIDNAMKRYFSVETVEEFTKNFEPEILDAEGETYKDAKKGVHNLIRFVGKKKTRFN